MRDWIRIISYLPVFLLCGEGALSQNPDSGRVSRILHELQNRQNQVLSIEYELTIHGETLPLFDNEEKARQSAEQSMRGNLDKDSEEYKKIVENNTLVLMQGYKPPTAIRHTYRIVGVDNTVSYNSLQENGMEQVLARFTHFEADYHPNNKQLTFNPRTHYLRSESPLFYSEVIVDGSSSLQVSIQKETDDEITIKAVGLENSRTPYKNRTYLLTLDKNGFIPRTQVESYASREEPRMDAKREIEYLDYKTDSSSYRYPARIVETHWKIEPPNTELKPWLKTIREIDAIHVNGLSLDQLNFDIPANTSVCNRFIKERDKMFSSTEKKIPVFDLARQLKIIP